MRRLGRNPSTVVLQTELRVLAIADAFTAGGTRDVIAISGGAGAETRNPLGIVIVGGRRADLLEKIAADRPDLARRIELRAEITLGDAEK